MSLNVNQVQYGYANSGKLPLHSTSMSSSTQYHGFAAGLDNTVSIDLYPRESGSPADGDWKLLGESEGLVDPTCEEANGTLEKVSIIYRCHTLPPLT